MKKDLAHQLGRQVRTLRKKHKLTQEKLAVRSKISLKYIQRIEGKDPPDLGLEYLQKLSDGFEIPLSELLKFE